MTDLGLSNEKSLDVKTGGQHMIGNRFQVLTSLCLAFTRILQIVMIKDMEYQAVVVDVINCQLGDPREVTFLSDFG